MALLEAIEFLAGLLPGTAQVAQALRVLRAAWRLVELLREADKRGEAALPAPIREALDALEREEAL